MSGTKQFREIEQLAKKSLVLPKAQIVLSTHDARPAKYFLQAEEMSYVSVRKSRKHEENATSRRCGLATLTECVPLPPESRGMNASTAGPHQTYNSWRVCSWFEHAKQAKVGGRSAGPKACLALLAERKQQREDALGTARKAAISLVSLLCRRFERPTRSVYSIRRRWRGAAQAETLALHTD